MSFERDKPRVRVLVITPNDIANDKGGLSIYTRQFLNSIEDTCEVRVVCLCENDKNPTTHLILPKAQVNYISSSRSKLSARLMSLFSTHPSYYFEYKKAEILALLNKITHKFAPQTIVLSHRRTSWLAFELSNLWNNISLVYINHNYEKSSISSLSKYSRNPIEKLLIKIEAWKVGVEETRAISCCNKVSFISMEDRREHQLSKDEDAFPVIPIYIEHDEFRTSNADRNSQNILFIGSANWLPKAENILWLANKILPRVLDQFPNARLILAGFHVSKIRNKIKASLTKSIDFYESPQQLSDLYSMARIFVVPEQQFGGVKIKTVQAAARGMAIVSTQAGISGTYLKDQHSVLVGNTEDEIAKLIAALLSDQSLVTAFSNRATQIAYQHFDKQRIRKLWMKLIE